MKFRLFTLLLLFPLFAEAKWINVTENMGIQMYYDNATVTSKGSVKRFMLLLDYGKENEASFMLNGESRYIKFYSATTLAYLTCNVPKIYFAAFAYYSLPMAQGEELAQETQFSRFEDMPKMESKSLQDWPKLQLFANRLCKK
ncbi:hypothetical protein LIN78_14320 [Leeia sp. TBRC 13508]|uniref:Surface-adhesin protein E-like domain-containing protein n=1 Tax=Leeia speluncae TaxID=2884804 RepID=A0ABS8D962_9NEIS|nr:surface-adhesin E family protein [Leeia speluncae]MCB6184720.1 hypothetical protein [Leeia speluncae]